MSDTHRRHDDTEDTPVPERAKPSVWGALEGMGTAIVATIAVCGVIATAGIDNYRLNLLEAWRDTHVTESKAQREKDDAANTAERQSVEAFKTEHGTRLTILEERYTAILQAITSVGAQQTAITKTLEDLAAKRGR
jgi:hypothetical protein